ADMRLAGDEEIDDILDVEFGFVIEHAIKEGGRTAKACGALVLLGRIGDALAQPRDDILEVNAGKGPAFGKRRKLVDQRQRVSLPKFFRGHLCLPTRAATKMTPHGMLRSRGVAEMSSSRDFVSSVSRAGRRGDTE